MRFNNSHRFPLRLPSFFPMHNTANANNSSSRSRSGSSAVLFLCPPSLKTMAEVAAAVAEITPTSYVKDTPNYHANANKNKTRDNFVLGVTYCVTSREGYRDGTTKWSAALSMTRR